jgi:proteinaceous RNase P
VDVGGKCCCCGEQLVSVDIDDDETERFAESVAGLAMEREVKANFSEFQVSDGSVCFCTWFLLIY